MRARNGRIAATLGFVCALYCVLFILIGCANKPKPLESVLKYDWLWHESVLVPGTGRGTLEIHNTSMKPVSGIQIAYTAEESFGSGQETTQVVGEIGPGESKRLSQRWALDEVHGIIISATGYAPTHLRFRRLRNGIAMIPQEGIPQVSSVCCEGPMSITMENQGISTEGIRLQSHFIMYDGKQVYELEFAKDCQFKGMEKQKEGMEFTLAGQSVRLHTLAKYRAKGVSVDTDIMYQGRPLRKLLVSQFECVEPGTGESGILISNI